VGDYHSEDYDDLQDKNQNIFQSRPPTFPKNVFPSCCTEIIREIAAAFAVPIEVPAITLLSVVGACIGRTRGIRIKTGWIEHANLYLGLVGRSGTGKTPATRPILVPVLEMEKIWLLEYEEQLRQAQDDQETAEDGAQKVESPHLRQLIVDDVTIEAMGETLKSNPRGVLWYRDELTGLLTDLDKYSGKKGGTKARLMTTYDSGPWKTNRITEDRNLYIANATVSIFGTIPPSALSSIFSDFDAAIGFLPRFLFIRVDQDKPPLWTNKTVSETTTIRLREILKKLLAFEFGPDDGPIIVDVSVPAKRLYTEWFNRQVIEPWVDADSAIYEAVLAKLRGQCLRIALILHCLSIASSRKSEFKVIGKDTMKKAITLADCLKEHQRQVWQQCIVTAVKVIEVTPLQRRAARAILDLQKENKSDFLETERIKDRMNYGNNARLHVNARSAGKAVSGLDLIAYRPKGSGGRGFKVTPADLARLKKIFSAI